MILLVSFLWTVVLSTPTAAPAMAATGQISMIVSYTSLLQFTDRKPHSIEVEAAMIANILVHPYVHLYVIYDSESEKNCSHFLLAMRNVASGAFLPGTDTVWSEESEDRLHCVDKKGGQPNYVDMLRYVSALPTVSDTILLANADVVLGEKLYLASNLSTGVVLTFSVTGFSPEGSPITKLYDQIVSPSDTRLHQLPDDFISCNTEWHRSYDALMFRRPVRYITKKDAKMFKVKSDGAPFTVYMNNLHAERVVIKALIYLGISESGTLWNMCKEVPAYHFHLTAKTHQSEIPVSVVPFKAPSLVNDSALENSTSCGRSVSINGYHFNDYPTLEDALKGTPRVRPYKWLDPLQEHHYQHHHNETSHISASKSNSVAAETATPKLSSIAIVTNINLPGRNDIDTYEVDANILLKNAASNPSASFFVLDGSHATGECSRLIHNLTMWGCRGLHTGLILRLHCAEGVVGQQLTYGHNLKFALRLLHTGDYDFVAIVHPSVLIKEGDLQIMTRSFSAAQPKAGSFATFNFNSKLKSIADKEDPACTKYYSIGVSKYRDCIHNARIGCSESSASNPSASASPFQILLLSSSYVRAGRMGEFDVSPLANVSPEDVGPSSSATMALLDALKLAEFANPVCV